MRRASRLSKVGRSSDDAAHLDFRLLACLAHATRIVFFEEAMQDARRLDEEFAATGRLKGPLHGVPISVKDQCTFFSSLLSPFLFRLWVLMRWRIVDVKGFDSTIGYTQWANKPAEKDAAVRVSGLPLPHPASFSHTPSYPPAHIGRLGAPCSRGHNLC